MAINNLPKYKDIRNSIRRSGRYPYVGTAVKDTIVIHHSLTPMKAAGSTPQAFANHHIDANGWHGCAYPFVITWDGTIHQTDDLDRRTYHAGNTNTRSIGICVAGDFRKGKEKPSQAQLDSLYLLVKELKEELPKLKTVLGHQECPGYSWKNCPGDNWNYKDVIAGRGVTVTPENPAPTKAVQPERLPDTYVVQEGDTFWSIAKELEGIDVDDLVARNPHVDPKALKIGMVLNLAKKAEGQSYTVKAGDTFWGIARAYNGVEMEDIIKANPSVDPKELKVGQKIIIPVAVSAPVSKPAPVAKPKPVAKPAPSKPKADNGIKVVGKIKMTEVKNFTYVYSKPSSGSGKLGQAKRNAVFNISGSVPGWWEVVYNGKRAYIADKYATRV
jgi:LysM repeat protein